MELRNKVGRKWGNRLFCRGRGGEGAIAQGASGQIRSLFGLLGGSSCSDANLSEAKAHLSELLERVAKGEEIIIGKAG
jgi:hypothetical protein